MYQQRQHLKPNPEGNCCHHALLQKQDHEGLPAMHLAKRAPVSERERLQSLRRVMAERVVGLVGLLSILRWRDQAPCNTESCDAACLDGSATRGAACKSRRRDDRGKPAVGLREEQTACTDMPEHSIAQDCKIGPLESLATAQLQLLWHSRAGPRDGAFCRVIASCPAVLLAWPWNPRTATDGGKT
ncbi:SPON1 [Symbiodinium microadriaticum]|nr:SPON1 [Symbiodinium microadriaticum]